MKLFLLYIPIVCITWVATLFHENKKPEVYKDEVSFELLPSNFLFEFNQ